MVVNICNDQETRGAMFTGSSIIKLTLRRGGQNLHPRRLPPNATVKPRKPSLPAASPSSSPSVYSKYIVYSALSLGCGCACFYSFNRYHETGISEAWSSKFKDLLCRDEKDKTFISWPAGWDFRGKVLKQYKEKEKLVEFEISELKKFGTLLKKLALNTEREFCSGIQNLYRDRHEIALRLQERGVFQLSKDAFSATWTYCECLWHDKRRRWTNVLIATNIFVHIADMAMQRRLFWWGAQINVLINRGQLWRLFTSVFLHGNIVHLMANCYALNLLGPKWESKAGPVRYLALYFSSEVSGSAMVYLFSKAFASIGASGAIFGLIGAELASTLGQKDLDQDQDSKLGLRPLVYCLLLEAVFARLLGIRISHSGHLGGLLGGAAAWRYLYP